MSPIRTASPYRTPTKRKVEEPAQPLTPKISDKRRRSVYQTHETQSVPYTQGMEIDEQPVSAFARMRMSTLNVQTAGRIFDAIRFNDGFELQRLNQSFGLMNLPVQFLSANTGHHFFLTHPAPPRVFISERLLAAKCKANERVLQMISSKLTDVVIALLVREHLGGHHTCPEFHDLPDPVLRKLVQHRRCYLDQPEAPPASLDDDAFTCAFLYPENISADDVRAFTACITQPTCI